MRILHRAEPYCRDVVLLGAGAELQRETVERVGVALSVYCDVPRMGAGSRPDPPRARRLDPQRRPERRRGARVVIAANRHDAMVRLTVHDDGTGVPVAVCDHLFEPFQSGRPKVPDRPVNRAGGSQSQAGMVTWRLENPGTMFELTLPMLALEARCPACS